MNAVADVEVLAEIEAAIAAGDATAVAHLSAELTDAADHLRFMRLAWDIRQRAAARTAAYPPSTAKD